MMKTKTGLIETLDPAQKVIANRNQVKRITAFGLGLFLIMGGMGNSLVWAGEFQLPDCEGLQKWVTNFSDGKSIKIAPKIEINEILKDELVEPLFGQSISQWNDNNTNAAKRSIKVCRNKAHKKRDKATVKKYNQTTRAILSAKAQFKKQNKVRESSHKKVKWLIGNNKSQDPHRLLELAMEVLQGKDVNTELAKVQLSSTYKRNISGLKSALDYLPANEIELLMNQLAERQSSLSAEMKTAKAEQEKTKQTQVQVLTTQKRSANHKVFQKSNQSYDIAARLAELVVTEDGKLTLRGVRPGISYTEAKTVMKEKWRFRLDPGSIMVKSFSPPRQDLANYVNKLGRNGGLVEMKTMKGKIGHIKFSERYTLPLKTQDVHTWLNKQLGKPETDEGKQSTWKVGQSFLTVSTKNWNVGSSGRYQSSLVMNLWSQAYTDYLENAKRQCAQIKQKPMSELTLVDQEALAMDCKTP